MRDAAPLPPPTVREHAVPRNSFIAAIEASSLDDDWSQPSIVAISIPFRFLQTIGVGLEARIVSPARDDSSRGTVLKTDGRAVRFMIM